MDCLSQLTIAAVGRSYFVQSWHLIHCCRFQVGNESQSVQNRRLTLYVNLLIFFATFERLEEP